MKTVLVTGAGGYIGSCLVDRLLKEGHAVRGLDRYFFGAELLGSEVLNHPQFTLIREDIRFVKPLHFKGVDVVFDLAGLSNDPSCELDPKLTEEINFKGTVNVAACAKTAGVKRYVFSSSCSVYGGGKKAALSESAKLNPVSHYALAKANAETAIMELASPGFTVSILRNGTVYGMSKRMRTDLIVNLMTVSAWKDKKLYIMGGGKQWRPLIHVNDVVEAFMLSMHAERTLVHKQIFNVGSDEQNYQVFQVAAIVQSIFNDVEILVLPEDSDKRTYNVGFEKISRVLGFTPSHTVKNAAAEIKVALETGKLDPSDPKNNTVKYYQYLIQAETVINQLSINGRVLDCA